MDDPAPRGAAKEREGVKGVKNRVEKRERGKNIGVTWCESVKNMEQKSRRSSIFFLR